MESNNIQKKRVQLLKFFSLVLYIAEVVLIASKYSKTLSSFFFMIRLLVFLLMEVCLSESFMSRILFLVLSFWFSLVGNHFFVIDINLTDKLFTYILTIQCIVQYKIIRSNPDFVFEIPLCLSIYIARTMFDLIHIKNSVIVLQFGVLALVLYFLGVLTKVKTINQYNCFSTTSTLSIIFFVYDLIYFHFKFPFQPQIVYIPLLDLFLAGSAVELLTLLSVILVYLIRSVAYSFVTINASLLSTQQAPNVQVLVIT